MSHNKVTRKGEVPRQIMKNYRFYLAWVPGFATAQRFEDYKSAWEWSEVLFAQTGQVATVEGVL